MSSLKDFIGWQFVQKTKFDRNTIHKIRSPLLHGSFNQKYKVSKLCFLPRPSKIDVPFSEVVSKRASCRTYIPRKISVQDLSNILWMGYGIREKKGNFYFGNAPSAGALYPLDIYVAIFHVATLENGIYRYNAYQNALEMIKKGDFSRELINGCLGQSFVGSGAFTALISAVFRRNMRKYGERGVRYIFIDAGHVVQNMILTAESLSLGACPVGAFFDNELNEIIGLDGEEETIIYLLSIGVRG